MTFLAHTLNAFLNRAVQALPDGTDRPRVFSLIVRYAKALYLSGPPSDVALTVQALRILADALELHESLAQAELAGTTLVSQSSHLSTKEH